MYVYIGTYFHVRHTGILSVIQNGEYITLEKKIGKTKDLSSRQNDLNRTKSPIGYTMLCAWMVGGDTDKIEKALHKLLDNIRLDGTEWFSDDDDTLIGRVTNFMETMGYQKVQFGEEQAVIADKINTSKWANEQKLVGMTFSARDVSIQCIGVKQWKLVGSEDIYETANKAFVTGLHRRGRGGKCQQNVWDVKEVNSGKTIREIHNGE